MRADDKRLCDLQRVEIINTVLYSAHYGSWRRVMTAPRKGHGSISPARRIHENESRQRQHFKLIL
jgi:hypothetical protein